MTGYEALHSAAAIVDLSSRGRIRATGEDRKRLFHAMTTNHVQDLQPGHSLYAFFLNSQGKILADADIYCADDHLLIDVEPEVVSKIYSHLDRYIIADDVTLEDITATTAEIAVEGPQALSLKHGPMVFERTATGQPGFRTVVPIEQKDAFLAELRAAGCVDASPEEVRAVRIESGVPRYGEDITELHLVQETGLMHAVHFNKGCYLGQEIVERVRSRGLVHRTLQPLRIETNSIPGPATPVLSADKEVGKITSAVFSPKENCVRALAYLRALENLTVAGAPAQVVSK